MSVFDDHLNPTTIDEENDKLILQHYKISNSGATLIPKEGLFAFSKAQKHRYGIRKNAAKLPPRTFREESSIFRSLPLGPNKTREIFEKYVSIIRSMNLPCLVYNGKRYYQVNREVKSQIAHKIMKERD